MLSIYVRLAVIEAEKWMLDTFFNYVFGGCVLTDDLYYTLWIIEISFSPFVRYLIAEETRRFSMISEF